MSLWCKLWNLVLNAFTDVVMVVASAVETLGEVAIALLDGMLSAVGSNASGFILLVGAGLLLYFLPKKQDDSDVKGGDYVEPNISQAGSTTIPERNQTG